METQTKLEINDGVIHTSSEQIVRINAIGDKYTVTPLLTLDRQPPENNDAFEAGADELRGIKPEDMRDGDFVRVILAEEDLSLKGIFIGGQLAIANDYSPNVTKEKILTSYMVFGPNVVSQADIDDAKMKVEAKKAFREDFPPDEGDDAEAMIKAGTDAAIKFLSVVPKGVDNAALEVWIGRLLVHTLNKFMLLRHPSQELPQEQLSRELSFVITSAIDDLAIGYNIDLVDRCIEKLMQIKSAACDCPNCRDKRGTLH